MGVYSSKDFKVYTIGNKSGEIPVANNQLCEGLNAEKLSGKVVSDFAPSGYGIGETLNNYIQDFNTATLGGLYYFADTAINAPLYISLGVCIVIPRRTNAGVTQIAFNALSKRIAIRGTINSENTEWSPWELIDAGTLSGKTIDELQLVSEKGQPNGYVGLDESGKISEVYLQKYLKSLSDDITPVLSGNLNCDKNTVYFSEIVDTGTVIDWSAGNKHTKVLTENITFTFTQPPGPTNLIFKLQQGATAYTVVWPSSVKWVEGVSPLCETVDKTYIFIFYYDGSNYYGSVCGWY